MNTTKSPHADSSITSATATAAREAYDAADKARSAAARNAQSYGGKVPSADALAALASARAVYAECKSALDAAVHARSAEAYAELFADDADFTLPRCKV